MSLFPRVIPVLLLQDGQLVKTKGFKNPKYVGDPMNAVKVFNDKEVDELILLDIDATRMNKSPDLKVLEDIVSEAFMPVTYGGGVRSVEVMKDLFYLGVEKICLNSAAIENPELVAKAADRFGSQSVVVAIDVKKSFFGKDRVWNPKTRKTLQKDPVAWATEVSRFGAGELLVTSVDREGSYQGYDLNLLESIRNAVSIPVTIQGGAKDLSSFKEAFKSGASGAAAGSIFVYYGPHRAVLVTYLHRKDLDSLRNDL